MDNITYLTQEQAHAVDEELMGPLGFSVDQLMELAGLSVAQSLGAEYPVASHRRVLVVAGPGNNGGDGLVAARHLTHFGYSVQVEHHLITRQPVWVLVCYPKRTDKPLYKGLVTQLEALRLPFLSAEAMQEAPMKLRFDLVLDALFGFGFKGPPRPPLDQLIELMKPKHDPPVVVSVDSPSGWDVELGDKHGDGLKPDMLVSLTAPKRGARHFQGRFHYLGGRFVPPAIKEKYHLVLPEYPGTLQYVRIK